MAGEPPALGGMLVSRVVVEDRVDSLARETGNVYSQYFGGDTPRAREERSAPHNSLIS